MGSIKKKLTKTLRKITPKEIAPVLPLIAMAVPGLGPVAGNALLRYGLPQLLTAAASARTSGEINPLNQALAAFASYAAAPDAAGQLTGKEKAFMRSEGVGTDFAKMTPEQLRADPSFAEAVKASGVKSATPGKDFLTGLTRTVGDPIRDLGQGEFNFRNLATVGALGATPAGIDAAKKYQKEQEELAAYEAGLFDSYDQAVQDYIASFTGMQSDPRRLYGLPNLFAAQGGRVAAQEGGIMATAPGMPPGMQVDGRDGGFIPMGVKEKADDVPAMLSKNEFVMTADAVRAAGGGSVNKGAQRMYDLMNNLEAMV
tara:strand:- start:392 stop:1333 length:942 start_codon:yes stop_codon:yes gene_type:complete